MEKAYSVGLVGIGKLGTALMKHWDANKVRIGIYHPNKIKAEQFVQRYPNGYVLTQNELGDNNVLLLALSANDIIPFISNLISQGINLSNTRIINLATALQTDQIREIMPQLEVIGIKYMGHSQDLFEHGNGLFISEFDLPTDVKELFLYQGKLFIDQEKKLSQVNKLATYYAVKSAVEIESIFEKNGLPRDYLERALTSIAPEVMRSYFKGNLGHFAQEIAREVKYKIKNND